MVSTTVRPSVTSSALLGSTSALGPIPVRRSGMCRSLGPKSTPNQALLLTRRPVHSSPVSLASFTAGAIGVDTTVSSHILGLEVTFSRCLSHMPPIRSGVFISPHPAAPVLGAPSTCTWDPLVFSVLPTKCHCESLTIVSGQAQRGLWKYTEGNVSQQKMA